MISEKTYKKLKVNIKVENIGTKMYFKFDINRQTTRKILN